MVGAFSRQDTTRRQVLSVLSTIPSLLLIDKADATCLTGDEASDCIGVYKESILPQSSKDGGDTITQSYGTFRPERPLVVLTNPQSLDEAVGMLQDQRLAIDDIERMITAGDMENAGMRVLRVLPRLTLAGRFIVTAMQNTVPQIQQMSDEVTALALVADNHIGKALHGKLGSTTVAQLTLLSDIKVVKVSLNNFIERATSFDSR
eukprot:CAMPEP_0172311654 /NCGR_PEP_ID=MMETSP1058-20130122/15413_1 /TAXON_ID=83371 /ORGANISM="Detonula confervacea, Strain CCMP 353" /LENGTH=204 /DNA_ID=CAMNT_0013024917 /DNA_START=174 /DNA_END=788 /DNA_ORIENTATION=+